MWTLNDQEKQFVQTALGPQCEVITFKNYYFFNKIQIHFTTVARLYRSLNGNWQYSGEIGALALVQTGNSHFLKIIDLKVKVSWKRSY